MGPDDGTTGGEAQRAVPSDEPRSDAGGFRDKAVEGVVAPAVSPLPRDPRALEDLIAERRADLAATIDEIVVRAHPKEIARRSVGSARGRLEAFATTSEGEWRTERIVAVAGAAVVLVSLLLLLRSRRGRSR
jgi:hypothetical protein